MSHTVMYVAPPKPEEQKALDLMTALLAARFFRHGIGFHIERDDQGYLQATFSCDGAPMLVEVRRSGPPEFSKVGWIAGNHDRHSLLHFHSGYGHTLVEAVAEFAKCFVSMECRIAERPDLYGEEDDI